MWVCMFLFWVFLIVLNKNYFVNKNHDGYNILLVTFNPKCFHIYPVLYELLIGTWNVLQFRILSEYRPIHFLVHIWRIKAWYYRTSSGRRRSYFECFHLQLQLFCLYYNIYLNLLIQNLSVFLCIFSLLFSLLC